MFTKAIRINALKTLTAALAVAVTAFSNSALLADQPASGLMPVPPMRSVPKPLHANSALKGSDRTDVAASRKLPWRTSEKLASEPASSAASSTSPSTAPPPSASGQQPTPSQTNSAGASSGGTSALGDMFLQTASPRQLRRGATASGQASGVSQVAYTQDLEVPGGAGVYRQAPFDGDFPPRVATQPPSDPFKDPFGDRAADYSSSAPSDRLIIQSQDQEPSGGFAIPSLDQNEDIGNSPWNTDEIPVPETRSDLRSPSDQMEQVPPSLTGPQYRPEVKSVTPVPRRNDTIADDYGNETRAVLGQYATTSCDELRQRLGSRTIRDISLDISPPFRPDILEKDTYDERFQEFQENQLPRSWRDYDGNLLVEGKFVELEFGHAIVEQSNGEKVELLLRRLSEPDIAYITEQWALPQECQLPNIAYQPRQWLPITMTWKASALCHKPLYFEEVNLERYGQTTGPFAQPLISTAHFFVNIAVLPYKMGVHPPNECQYALGYYRPGNCAPWIIPPVPISLRGALFQAGAVGAGIGLIP